MSDKNSKKKTKRLPKGQRTHIRRLKQATRKETSPNNPSSSRVQPVRGSENQE